MLSKILYHWEELKNAEIQKTDSQKVLSNRKALPVEQGKCVAPTGKWFDKCRYKSTYVFTVKSYIPTGLHTSEKAPGQLQDSYRCEVAT